MRLCSVLLIAALSLSCAESLQHKEAKARTAAEMGLVSHPELSDINTRLDILIRNQETILAKLAALDEARVTDLEAHRADVEMVLEAVRRVKP